MGFSGGSRVAEIAALAYPDVFRGAILNAGADPIDGQDGIDKPPADLLRAFQRLAAGLTSPAARTRATAAGRREPRPHARRLRHEHRDQGRPATGTPAAGRRRPRRGAGCPRGAEDPRPGRARPLQRPRRPRDRRPAGPRRVRDHARRPRWGPGSAQGHRREVRRLGRARDPRPRRPALWLVRHQRRAGGGADGVGPEQRPLAATSRSARSSAAANSSPVVGEKRAM